MSRALQLQHVAIGGIGAVLRVRQSSVVRQAASEPSGEISSRKAKPNLASCFEGGVASVVSRACEASYAR